MRSALAVLLAPVLALLPGAASGAGAASGIGDPVDARVAAGRALYRGDRPWRHAPTLHGIALDAKSQACAACHGARGEGRTEAGVAAPPLRWQHLAQPGPNRAAYADPARVLRAVEEGRSGDGRPLSAPMPRFALTDEERVALAAYLQVLGTDADPVPGVDARRVVLGSVLPSSGPQAATGERIRRALQAGVARVNDAGGVFGRRLELVAVDAGPDAASASAAARALVESGRVFALVASLVPAPDETLRRTLARRETAMVANLGMAVTLPADEPLVTWLLPSLAVQLRVLATTLARDCPPGPPGRDDAVRVLHAEGGAAAALRAVMADVQGLPPLHWQETSGADALRGSLRDPAGPVRTIVLAPPALAAAAREAVRGSGHCLGTLAALSGDGPASPGTREVVVLPMPVPSSDADAASGLWPLLAGSALDATVEALARTGRQLDTAGFVAALDTLYGFSPRPGLPLGFSPRRRYGLDVSFRWKEASDEAHPSPRP